MTALRFHTKGETSEEPGLPVTLDCRMTKSQHILSSCRTAYFFLRRISSVRHLLTQEATQTLIRSYVLSRLDYWNSLLAGCTKHLIDKLLHISSSRPPKETTCNTSIQTLHWLPISTLCFNNFTDTAPIYLSECLRPYVPAQPLRSPSDCQIQSTPRVSIETFGQRSFSFIAPKTWNELPHSLCHFESSTSSRQAQKLIFSSSSLFHSLPSTLFLN